MLFDPQSLQYQSSRKLVRSTFNIGYLLLPYVAFQSSVWILLAILVFFLVLHYYQLKSVLRLSQYNQQRSYRSLVNKAYGKKAEQFVKYLIVFAQIMFLSLMQMLIAQFIVQLFALKNSSDIYEKQTKDDRLLKYTTYGNNLRIYINLIIFPIILIFALFKENHFYVRMASSLKQFTFYLTAFILYVIYWINSGNPEIEQYNEEIICEYIQLKNY